jgi:hypothetical protein
VTEDDYVGCLELITTKESINRVAGILRVNSSHLIDYEKFQTLYLAIVAIDHNTVLNEDSTMGTLTILVIDVNDNAPEFVGNTLSVSRSVVEEATTDTFVGVIYAIDRDGPPFNDITFKLM